MRSDTPTNKLHSGWLAELWYRLCRLTWLKTLGTTGYMWTFFEVYFWLLHNPQRPLIVMPDTWVDRIVPFMPWWVVVDFSLWAYVSLPGSMQKNWSQLFLHGLSAIFMCGSGLLFYYYLPTTFVPPPLDWSHVALGRVLQSIDKPGNAFPSMHVAYAVFAWFWIRRELYDMRAPVWTRYASALWCIGIAFSTLATKQHVWWDVVAGGLLGGSWGWLSVLLARHQRTSTAILNIFPKWLKL